MALAVIGLGCGGEPPEDGVDIGGATQTPADPSAPSLGGGGTLGGAAGAPAAGGRASRGGPTAGNGGMAGNGDRADGGAARMAGMTDAAGAGAGSTAGMPGAARTAGMTDAAGAGAGGAAGVTGRAGATGMAGAAGSEPGACGNKPGLHRGMTNQTVLAGGFLRSFVYYAPADLDPNEPAPLVIVPHGFTMSGEAMVDITGYDKIADREGFVVAYPDGGAGVGPWNVGDGICGLGAFVLGVNDDQAFIDEIIAFVAADRCLDADHVFVTGFSMGGYFSNETACLRSDIAAVGPHSGGTHDLSACPGDKKPIIIFHVRGDSLIGYECGAEAAERWVRQNGCSALLPEVRPVQGGACEYYRGCPPDAQVAFCSFDIPLDGGGTLLAGHGWSGGAPNPFSVTGTTSASELGWEFFKEFAW